MERCPYRRKLFGRVLPWVWVGFCFFPECPNPVVCRTSNDHIGIALDSARWPYEWVIAAPGYCEVFGT